MRTLLGYSIIFRGNIQTTKECQAIILITWRAVSIDTITVKMILGTSYLIDH